MRILLVDDHPEVRLSLAGFIESLGHSTAHASTGAEALAAARSQRPDLVISDLRMPGMSGIDLLQTLEELDDPPPFALMTAFGDAETAIQAMRLGAVDYLRKPIDVRELHRVIERVAAESTTPHQPTPLVGLPIPEQPDGLVIAGPTMARVVAFADRLHAAPDLPCLIEAETGCGKELISRRIHHGGRPSATPFVAINCAAIAPGLFEAELFGYAAGSFTGALAGGSQGKLALAAGGTLLLDEIADLPLDQQAKLLRVLEERSWYPVGSNQLQRMKARVVCACNSDLLDRVHAKRFREDLYYRLKVGHLRIPPLRERRDEIMPLARSLLVRIRKTRGSGPQRFSSAAERLLESQPWPGNVRQLRHLLEQACLIADGAVLDAPALAELGPNAAPSTITTSAANALPRPPMILTLPDGSFDLDAWTRAVIAAALTRNDGSPVRTAAYLGLTRKVLYTLRKRYGLLAGTEPK